MAVPGSASSSNKIKINSIYPHSCSHSVIHDHAVMHAVTHTEPTRSFFRSFTSCFNRASASARASIVEEPERPTQKWIVLTHWINPRGHQTKALRSLRARNPRMVDSREQNGWLSWILVRPAFRFFRALAGQSSTPSITVGLFSRISSSTSPVSCCDSF